MRVILNIVLLLALFTPLRSTIVTPKVDCERCTLQNPCPIVDPNNFSKNIESETVWTYCYDNKWYELCTESTRWFESYNDACELNVKSI